MGRGAPADARAGGRTLIGVISDTHGLLRPEALEALRGVEAIVHAGDVGRPDILEELRGIAPVTAVHGNVDRGALIRDLPSTAILDAGGASIYVLHDLAQLDLNPRAAGFGVVVSGHTHAPVIREKDGVLYLNPGSAGPRRFDLPVSIAMLTVVDGAPSAAIIELPIAP
ncbi:MAG TPA: metallophosphoesterase family protein [Candidatus Binatia bacterium]|nr:metallophosphoesterase family protein [Candidatus Binatia bacterium]